MVNPLVASAVDTTSPFSGAYLIEDGRALVDAVTSGNWIDGGIAAFSAALDTAAMIVDPIGTLIANGLGWVLDHVEPLKGWLNDVTGDAAEVAAFAQTWRNIATQLHDSADTFARRTHDLDGMSGATIDAYLAFAGDTIAHLRSTGDWATAIAGGLEVAGGMVQAVHDLVRDAISQIVGTAISMLTELAITVGFATPAVIGQISTKVSSLAARVGKTVTRLLTSLKKLSELLQALQELFGKAGTLIRKMLAGTAEGRRSGAAGTSHSPQFPPTGADPRPVRRGDFGRWDWAETAYDDFRSSQLDIDEIVSHPQSVTLPDGRTLNREDLELIKRHVMFDEHLVSDYEGGHVRARFAANPEMADAWYRLQNGDPVPSDLVLLQHELAEARYREPILDALTLRPMKLPVASQIGTQ